MDRRLPVSGDVREGKSVTDEFARRMNAGHAMWSATATHSQAP
ncbi:MAG: hypothetical protein OQK74_02730 [Gammaproteobacteria bacterium]|nr:hypothetical protein [Gammaproteobacteria bacterium]